MNFNPFYKKPKPSTMKANREIARKHFKKELKWLKDNMDRLVKNKHKFLIEMYFFSVFSLVFSLARRWRIFF